MISIIVPVYNAAPYLPQCLDSLVNQTYRDIEIICVNDGSTDNSLDILKAYAERDSRILVIHQENQGLSDARNKGLENARGEWVMFVDNDDWIDISTCQITLETVHAHQADVVMWTYNREYEGHSLPKYYITSLQTWDANNISQLHRRMVGPINEELNSPDTMDAWGTIWAKLYRRTYIDHPVPVRFIDTKISVLQKMYYST